MKTYTPEKLAEVLRLHKLRLDEDGGVRANLSRANLSRANLSRANLSGANLSRADDIPAFIKWLQETFVEDNDNE